MKMPVVKAPTVKLNNGEEMPVLGLGTWLMFKDEELDVVKTAIDLGYRHFDTAYLYNSEKIIGEAIRQKVADGTITRKDLFITTKLWCTYAHPHQVVQACKNSLKNLGLDYVDLYLIHWPFLFEAADDVDNPRDKTFHDFQSLFAVKEFFPRDSAGNLSITDCDYLDTWKEMEKCVELGLTKSIGVSNFNSVQLDRILQIAKIKPVTNQVENHPYLNQKKLIQFCRERDIIITSYGPLGGVVPLKTPGLPKMLEHPTIVKIAKEKNKTTAQIALKYLVQLGNVVIPKTSNPKRLLENISIFDFNLSPEEMKEMDSMNCNERIYAVPGSENHKNFPFNIEF